MKNIIRQLLVFFVFVVSLNLAAQTLPVITGQVKCQGRVFITIEQPKLIRNIRV